MVIRMRRRAACAALGALLWAPAAADPAPEPDAASVVRMIDAEVQHRVQAVLEFTDIEHYRVFRGGDETHAVAEMTAKDLYRKGSGKTYTVLSRSGSDIVLKFGLKPLIENEKRINNPATVAQSWFTSANYIMKLKPGGIQKVNGRDCYVLSIAPKQKAPNMIDGTLWVDAHDGSIAQVEGVASKSPSPFAGTTHMMRRYTQIEGFPMATHARAESSSLLFGRTVVLIDYSDYHLQIAPHK
ncbi:MAG TPA: hypothetical protein VMD55_11130 [Terracidiphilus sp.]|nr:hypothetical protein [Terracidiphilus sp.]